MSASEHINAVEESWLKRTLSFWSLGIITHEGCLDQYFHQSPIRIIRTQMGRSTDAIMGNSVFMSQSFLYCMLAVANTDSIGPFWDLTLFQLYMYLFCDEYRSQTVGPWKLREAPDRLEHPDHKSLKRQSLAHEMNPSSNSPKSQVQIFKVFARIRVDLLLWWQPAN